MQDSEVHGSITTNNARLMSDLGATRRQSRSLYKNLPMVSIKAAGYSTYQSQTNVMTQISSSSTANNIDYLRQSACSLIEDRADEIVRHMELSQTLMEHNPKSENDRIETLRGMTEYLTLKRSVKKKLTKSIKPNSKALGFSKRLKYSISIFFFKIPIAMKSFLNNFELWYSSLKVIEGHFGSSVASYFKFLRKLFLLNACIFILTSIFIMAPQLLFRFTQYVEDDKEVSEKDLENNVSEPKPNLFFEDFKMSSLVMLRRHPYQNNDEFRLGNLFTGEGFFTNTILFYGYYTNTSLKLISGHSFNIPASYFFTSAVSYIIIFVFLFTSVAVSYRKCYIEASGGMNNTFSNKIFCGWDYGIATKQAADLKSKSIYIEVKELLDGISKPNRKKSCLQTFYTTAISLSLNGILLFLLGVGGMYSWKFLDQQMTRADTATTMMMWLVLTLVIAVAPVLFSLITHAEGFESRSSALYMTLIRTFTLYAVVIAVVVGYRINRSSESVCWETILGQDMYRLVLLDFIFGLIGTALSEFIRYRIYVKMWEGIGCPEFDIARSTMNLLYNQTLFYVGLYFSPVLSIIITIKMFLTFYIKKWGAIYNCKPFLKPWKASQAHTVYLSIAFVSFFSVVIAYGYIITSVKTSNCGPFRGEKFMYESILSELLENRESVIFTILYYITRPGVVGIILMALLLGVYYMRAVALARIHVVNHLRHLLILKAEDRKLLLLEIAKYTKNQTSQKSEPAAEEFKNSFSPNLERARVDPLRIEENLKKSKLRFSSLMNLPKDSQLDHSSRNGVFNSIQDFSHIVFNEDEEYTRQSNEDNLINNSAFEVLELSETRKSEPENLDDSNQYENISTVTTEAQNKDSVDDEQNDNDAFKSGVRRLNFNPVFTESFSLGDPEDLTNETKAVKSGGSQTEESQAVEEKGNNDDSSQFRLYQRFHERVPSRISFDSDRKESKMKKRR